MLQVMISEVFGEELSALRGVGLIHWNLSQLNKVRLDRCLTVLGISAGNHVVSLTRIQILTNRSLQRG